MSSLYFEAASIIKQIKSKKSSLKNLVFNSQAKNKKALYALVCETLKFQEVFKNILGNVRLLEKEKSIKRNEDLAMVLLYEHILGKGVSGHFKECFSRHKSSIHSQCELLKMKNKITDLRQLVKDSPGENLPKYVRVNTLKTLTNSVVQQFKDAGRTLITCSRDTESAEDLSSKTLMVDPHVPDLLVFEASTDFHKHPLYTSGEIILQDKASCFPAYILSPPPGSHVIDCCAAPGNKTSHLACLMENKGGIESVTCSHDAIKRENMIRKVFAFDKDKNRLSTLQKLTGKAGATCIQATCADFLEVKTSDVKYKDVEYILVDPSCSGSGMINRTSQFTDETDSCSSDRLQQLAKFQTNILKHALSFPAVKKVVYSTCSIHEEENEQVVEEILSHCGDRFELVNIEPDWSERGVKGYEHAQFCLRMSHDSCLTNGFFVACFQRKGKQEVKKVHKNKDIFDSDVRTSNGIEIYEEGKCLQIKDKVAVGESFQGQTKNRCKKRKVKKKIEEEYGKGVGHSGNAKKARVEEHGEVLKNQEETYNVAIVKSFLEPNKNKSKKRKAKNKMKEKIDGDEFNHSEKAKKAKLDEHTPINPTVVHEASQTTQKDIASVALKQIDTINNATNNKSMKPTNDNCSSNVKQKKKKKTKQVTL